jgi:hypothetical protein
LNTDDSPTAVHFPKGELSLKIARPDHVVTQGSEALRLLEVRAKNTFTNFQRTQGGDVRLQPDRLQIHPLNQHFTSSSGYF